MSGSIAFHTSTTWTVPETGDYYIIAAGSQGGTNGAGGPPGGKGAVIGGHFVLNAGDQVNIVSGNAEGGPEPGNGGDATFVVLNGNPLVVAGGGGGGGFSSAGGPGLTVTNGGAGQGGFAGGTNGGGGSAFVSGGGGGYFGDGQGSLGVGGGLSYALIESAYGGFAQSGGFSDQGGNTGAGGGGYSGGGGSSYGGAGGGGGSIDNSPAINRAAVSGVNTGNGYAIITRWTPLLDPPNLVFPNNVSQKVGVAGQPFLGDIIDRPGKALFFLTITQSDPANGTLVDPNAATDGSYVDGNLFGAVGNLDDINSIFENLTYTLNNARGTTFDIKVTDAAGNIGEDHFHVAAGKGPPTSTKGTSDDDVLVGASGKDRILGGAGNDLLIGGAGNDTLRGGTGNDILIGGLGSDVLHGGKGSDVFLHSAGDGADTITGFQNGDRLVLAGYTIDHHNLAFTDLDTIRDGIIGNGDNTVSFTRNDDLVLNLAAYGSSGPDSVTIRGVAFLHSTDVIVT